jgi:hypothetical protein
MMGQDNRATMIEWNAPVVRQEERGLELDTVQRNAEEVD